jgi:hypothetical protein
VVPLSALDEITALLSGPSRAIIISTADVDFRPESGDARLFVLKIGEGSLAAGGRGGGFGERKVTGAYCFEKKGGAWFRVFAAEGEERASAFEVPYYVSRLPFMMADGTESMGYGVVDPQLVAEMSKNLSLPSPA